MAEVRKSIYGEALFKQLHFILGIWSPLKAFIDIYYPFLTFTADLTFGKILNIWKGKR